MYIKNFRHDDLTINELKTTQGKAWCIYGENRSGINRLLELLSGKLDNYSIGNLELPDRLAILSFQVQQEVFEEEMRNDDSDFLERIDPGTLVREFLPDYDNHFPLLKAFGMDHCLDLGYRQLSSGQCRKLLFLQKLTGGATTLVIQNPYDGLDEKSCHELNLALQQLPASNIDVILFVNSKSDIPSWCSHLALISSGHLQKAGKRELVYPMLLENEEPTRESHDGIASLYLQQNAPKQCPGDELVYLRDGFAGYGNSKKLFTGFDLAIYEGDHTLITGPNGCGKSTLLDIITGDNPKCYANNLRIFGRQRGSGESIWDIKQHMGIVSPTLHREHRVPGSVLHIILSGLHDSIGLYKKVHNTEVKKAMLWLDWIALQEKCNIPFRRMPFAEQRLVLIARALIKRPKLLILDEPTQGLDDNYRFTLLGLLEKIAANRLSTILFVSHRKDEYRHFFRKHIQLDSFSPKLSGL